MSRLIYGTAAAALLAFAAPASAQVRHPLHPSLESSAPLPARTQQMAQQTTTPANPPVAAQEPTAPAAPAPPAEPGSFTDAQLSNFLAASTEIQPLTTNLSTATPDQRTGITTQIRAALQRHNIDGATYNAIATAAQSDTALAARINGLRSSMASTPGASTSGEGLNAGGRYTPPEVSQPTTPRH